MARGWRSCNSDLWAQGRRQTKQGNVKTGFTHMGMLTTAAKRLTGSDVRQLPCPVKARDSYRTMVFSLHDQTPAPSPRLMRTALDAMRLVLDGKVDLKDIAARPNAPDWFDVWPGEHYRLLA